MGARRRIRREVEQGGVSIEDPLESQTAGRSGEDPGPGDRMMQQTFKISHGEPAATHFEQGADHSADLITEETLSDKMELQPLLPGFDPDSVQRSHR